MGCGDSRMKLEDEMIKLKFERSRIQMERKKQIQLLEGIEHRKIAESIIPDYIGLEPEKAEIKIKTEEQTKSTRINNLTNKCRFLIFLHIVFTFFTNYQWVSFSTCTP